MFRLTSLEPQCMTKYICFCPQIHKDDSREIRTPASVGWTIHEQGNCGSRESISAGKRLCLSLRYQVAFLRCRESNCVKNNKRDVRRHLASSKGCLHDSTQSNPTVAKNCARVRRAMELSKLPRGFGWKAHQHRVSKKCWFCIL